MTDSDVGNHEHSITDDIVFSELMYLLKQGRKVYYWKDLKTSIKAYSVGYSPVSTNKQLQNTLHIIECLIHGPLILG